MSVSDTADFMENLHESYLIIIIDLVSFLHRREEETHKTHLKQQSQTGGIKTGTISFTTVFNSYLRLLYPATWLLSHVNYSAPWPQTLTL